MAILIEGVENPAITERRQIERRVTELLAPFKGQAITQLNETQRRNLAEVVLLLLGIIKPDGVIQ